MILTDKENFKMNMNEFSTYTKNELERLVSLIEAELYERELSEMIVSETMSDWEEPLTVGD